MLKELLPMAVAPGLLLILASAPVAQSSGRSVPATEVNGTFRHHFTGKYKGSFNEINIYAHGNGKLRVAFDLTYPFTDGTGELSANLGQADGIAAISGDTAVSELKSAGAIA